MRIPARQLGIVLVSLLAALALLLASSVAHGEPADDVAVDEDSSGNAYVAGELLVTYKEAIPSRPVDALDVPLEPEVDETMPEVGTVLLEFPEVKSETSENARTRDLARARVELEADPAVASVEYNYLDTLLAAPNDPRYKEQWGLRKARFDDEPYAGQGREDSHSGQRGRHEAR